MVAEPWILKMGNQVSHNLKHSLLLETAKKNSTKNLKNKQLIGILSFEVANVMSKTVHLHKSLTDQEIHRLRNEILNSEGIRTLVSSDESYLLGLALVEKLEDLNRVAIVVSRLGKKCSVPALQGFEHVYSDIVSGVIDVRELGFLVKDMEGMIKKLERFVNTTANLYGEMEVLNELEQAAKKFQNSQHEESRRAFEQKLSWQRQDVRSLKDVSLWNQSYDKVVELLARSVCTIYARICSVFGDVALRRVILGVSLGVHFSGSSLLEGDECSKVSSQIDIPHGVRKASESLNHVLSKKSNECVSGPIEKGMRECRGANFRSRHQLQRGEVAMFKHEELLFPCGTSPGRLFMECLSMSSSGSKIDDDDVDDVGFEDRCSQSSGYYSVANSLKKGHSDHSGYFSRSQVSIPFSGDQSQLKSSAANNARFSPKSRLTVQAPSTTIGGSALALHYANVIIVIEKLLRYPHLVGEEARDDLYQMLPTSLRVSLRTNLKSYVKNLAIYDAPLAHDWKETLDGILKWLAPLAHNMIRWQSERNFEQQQIVKRTNVLLLQTLYFADRAKTEKAICDLLVGLNYICRYEHQQNALLDCASSFDFEDCMQWQMQYSSSFPH
ncbi:protein of unknown function DUF3475 [Dillenia turbinata]|uniref:Uncharacterized protein n=1 Tax=Dillenia turbinata TaxID=194707 RepID=A0AAN8VI37_9MAGN